MHLSSVRRGLILGAGLLLGSVISARGGEITATVDKVDMESRTILVGGETIKIPEGMNVEGIQEGSRYKIIYSGEGENKILTEFIEKRT